MEQALSYVQRVAGKQNVIKRYVLSTAVSSPIVNTLPGQDFFCWIQSSAGSDVKRFLLSSDGARILCHDDNSFIEFKDKTWQPVVIEGTTTMLKGVTRMAANANYTNLAVVVGE